MKTLKNCPAVLLVFLTVIYADAQERVKRPAPRLIQMVEQAGPVEPLYADYPVEENSSIILQEVNEFVENIRCILGAGRNIIRLPNGEIHVALLEGTTGSYELYWAGSTDDGMNWQTSSHLGGNQLDDDRYPALAVSTAGEAYIAFHQPFSPGTAYVVELTDPFGDIWVTHGPLNGSIPSAELSFAYLSPGGRFASGWLNNSTGQGMVGVSNGICWLDIAMIHDTTEGLVDMGPAVAIEGDYVIAVYTSPNDPALVPPDTTVIHRFGYHNYYGFRESTDGGATWSASQTPYGLTLADFPTTRGDRNGTVGQVAMATGTWWQNVNSPFIVNGKVYVCFENGAVTLNDGVFPYGYWDGIMTASCGWKAALPGGNWEHHAISTMESDAADLLLTGEIWQPEMGYWPSFPGLLAMVAVDLAAPDGEEELVAFASVDGVYWVATFRERASYLGFPPGTALYSAMSTWLNQPYPDVLVADIVLLGDNGGIVNTTLYHTQISLITVGIAENSTGGFGSIRLNQNYPNPFNPLTQIQFNLSQTARANLSVYNALGQKVAELVNGTVTAGEHIVMFDGAGLASGVYFYRLTVDEFSQTRKMLFVR